jgi:hypothetical protein
MDFIEEYEIDASICDSIIKYFEDESTPKIVGHTAGGINKSYKDSTDATLKGELLEVYTNELNKCVDKYKEKWPNCNNIVDSWRICEGINIQKYDPGQGYKAVHCERSEGKNPVVQRFLVFMTYLNDVNDSGETEFVHQGRRIKPVKGKTVIWPAEWTHAHRGIVSNSETKYIATGWISLVVQYYKGI